MSEQSQAASTAGDAAIGVLKDALKAAHVENIALKGQNTTLANENANLKASVEKAVADAKAASDKAKADLEAAVAGAQTAHQDRLKEAEVKSALTKAGAVDPAVIKLLDLSKVTIKGDGTVDGVDALITEAKKAKPALFGPGSTSASGKAPDPKQGGGKTAAEMTDAEFDAAIKQIGRTGVVP